MYITGMNPPFQLQLCCRNSSLGAMQPASSHAAPASHYRVADNVNRGP
eukprot:SAG25_NODE_8459_length_421_cov_0.680124_1_plen_47_part_01